MKGNGWRARAAAATCAAVCALAAGAAPAFGAVSASSVAVSSPSGTYLTDVFGSSSDTQITVNGTSNGHSGDVVDLNCYAGTSWRTLKSGVLVGDGGSFSYTGSLAPINDQACVLRAVPPATADQPPGSSSAFTGPTLGIGKLQDFYANSAQSPLAYYDLFAAQLSGAFHYLSLGGCTIYASFVYDPVTLQSAPLDFCNGGFWWRDGYPSRAGFRGPTRSEIQVDGANALLAGHMSNIGTFAMQNPGFPGLSYGYSIDPATGNLTLDETDQVVKCGSSGGSGAYPPAATNCSSFVPTGVQVRLRIEQSQSGRVATITQTFSSTDGAAHNVDVLEDNEFAHPNHDGRLSFPWTGGGLQSYGTAGQVIPGPAAGSGPGSFFIKGSAAVPDGGESSAQGAVSFSNPPDRAEIVGTTNNADGFSWVDLHYARAVPASGTVALAFTYSNAFLAGETAGRASAAEASFRPSLSITSPAPGAVSSQPTAVLSGTAGDARQLTSLTVNGVPQAVSNGHWSATVPLNPGSNPITVLATNLFGNTAQTQTAITYTPPPPPPPPPHPAPAISHVSQTHPTFRPSGRRRRGRPPVGTTIAMTLNEAAHVTFTVKQRAGGRMVRRHCVAPTRRNRARRACVRTVTKGSISFAAQAGRNLVKFYGALGNQRALPPGTYTLLIRATDPATGQASGTRQLRFTIAR